MEKWINGKLYSTAFSRTIAHCQMETASVGVYHNLFETLCCSKGGDYFLCTKRHRFLGFGIVEDITLVSSSEAMNWSKKNNVYHLCILNKEFIDTASDDDIVKALILSSKFGWDHQLNHQLKDGYHCDNLRLNTSNDNQLHFITSPQFSFLSQGIYAFSQWGKPKINYDDTEYHPHNKYLYNVTSLKKSGILNTKDAFVYAKRNGFLSDCIMKGHFCDASQIG